MSTRMRRITLGLMLVLALGLLFSSCADEGQGDGKRPFGPPGKTTRYLFGLEGEGGAINPVSAGVIGDITVKGESYWLAEVTGWDGSAEPPKYHLYLRFENPLHGVFVGGKLDRFDGDIPLGSAETPFIEGELDEPYIVNLDPPVGEEVPLVVTGTGSFLGQAATVSVEGSYTLVESNVSVETVMGVIHDCRYFKGSIAVSSPELPPILSGMELTAEMYYSETKGVVGVILRRPPFEPVVLGLMGVEDLGEGDGTYGDIQKAAVIGGPGQSDFRLSTYDVNQEFDADKDTHAKMILEIRYLDETLAKTGNQPQVTAEFTTGWGYYPYYFVESPVSFFHPEEQGMGYTYWIAYVDQAAKNESDNGIVYNISAANPEGQPPVRATARILYKRYVP